jgi:hypothetical protein
MIWQMINATPSPQASSGRTLGRDLDAKASVVSHYGKNGIVLRGAPSVPGTQYHYGRLGRGGRQSGDRACAPIRMELSRQEGTNGSRQIAFDAPANAMPVDCRPRRRSERQRRPLAECRQSVSAIFPAPAVMMSMRSVTMAPVPQEVGIVTEWGISISEPGMRRSTISASRFAA